MSLPQALFEKITTKLGLRPSVSTDLQGLAAVYKAWCQGVGYDNVSLLKYLDADAGGAVPGMPSQNYFELWLDQGVANFCWANSEALKALLDHYGFRTSRVIGTMGTARNLPITAMPHGSLSVHIDDTKYLVDATFLCEEPLPVIDNTETTAGQEFLQVWSDPDGQIRWQLPQSRFSGSFRIEREGVEYGEFEAEHKRTVDGLANGRLYRDRLYIRRNVDGGTVTFDHGHIIRRRDGKFSIDRVDPATARDMVKAEFGLGDAAVSDIPEGAF